MNASWTADAAEPFVAYSPFHLAAIGLFILSTVLLYLGRYRLRTDSRRRGMRYALAGILAACEISLNVWYVQTGVFDARDTLPLELCSISLYLCVAMLLTGSRRLFGIVYFTGIGGALQALATPVLGYAFPHFRFIEFFIAHIAIILSVLYMVWVERYRPGWRSLGAAMLFLNLVLLPILLVNRATGGNYMFLSHKPDTASLLDLLGPYPWYLLSMEAVAFVLFVILLLPFLLQSRRTLH